MRGNLVNTGFPRRHPRHHQAFRPKRLAGCDQGRDLRLQQIRDHVSGRTGQSVNLDGACKQWRREMVREIPGWRLVTVHQKKAPVADVFAVGPSAIVQLPCAGLTPAKSFRLFHGDPRPFPEALRPAANGEKNVYAAGEAHLTIQRFAKAVMTRTPRGGACLGRTATFSPAPTDATAMPVGMRLMPQRDSFGAVVVADNTLCGEVDVCRATIAPL